MTTDTTTAPETFRPAGRDSDLGDMYELTHQVAKTWRGEVTGSASAEATQAINNIQAAIAKATAASRNGYVKAKTAANDERFQDSWNQKEATRIAGEHETQASDALKDAEANLGMLNAFLEDDARPKLAKGEELTARADLQLVLQGANNLSAVSDRLETLAAQDGSLGALASDPAMIRLVAMSKGFSASDVDGLVAVTKLAALNAALESHDPARQTAAKLRMQTARLQGAITAAHSLRRHARQKSAR